MGRLPALLIFPLLICASISASVQAQTTLQPGNSVERTLGPNQVQDFIVTLEENTLIQFVVEQKGIDVVVKVLSPEGKVLGEYDSPNGDDGPEHVSLVGGAAGNYRISISPLNSAETPEGKFQIKILEQRQATEQEIKASRYQEAAKAKGIALLGELDGTIPQIKSPLTRIRAQMQAAQLLWEAEPKRAAKFLNDATAAVKEFLTTVDVNSPQYPQQYGMISSLRFEMIHQLAERDPEAAWNFFQATVPPANPHVATGEHVAQENMLELAIANRLAKNDPERALKIARRNLKSRLSTNLIPTLSSLRRDKPELASEFAGEIAAKLVESKLLTNSDVASLAIGLLRFGTMPRRGRIQNEQSVALKNPLLSEAQYRDLLQKIFNEAISYSSPAPNTYTPERDAAWNLLSGLQQLGSELDAVVNGGAAMVEKKFSEMQHHTGSPAQQYQNEIANAPVDNALESIEKAPVDQREQLYVQLAGREANNGDIARARTIINENVTNPYQRRNALMNLEQAEIYRAMSKGKPEEALRIISGFRYPRERSNHIAQIAGQIGPGQKRAYAINLLEQAKALLPASPQAQDQDHLNALIEIARAYARYDVKKSFEIIEPLIDQVNDICAAARVLEGFGPEYFEDDELNIQNGSSVAQVATRVSSVLGTLAITNFERAKIASDRLRLPEVRLRSYLDIAQQTILGPTR